MIFIYSSRLSVLLGMLAITLVAMPAMAQNSDAQNTQQSIEILKNRIDALTEQVERLKTLPPMQKIEFPAPPAFDSEEFERIKNKAEALEDQFENQGLKGLKIGGALDPVYVMNRRQKSTSFSFLNGFSGSDPSSAYAYDNSFFGLGLLDFQKETRDNSKFRLTMAFGKSAGSVNNANALLHEASASIPLSDLQTRLLVGQLPDFSGYEPFFSHLQPLISHNLLFDFAAPAFYTGAGVEILRDKWLSKVIIGNMNYGRYRAGDNVPTLALRVDYAKGEFKGFGVSAQNGRISTSRFSMAEADGYFIRGDMTLQGQVSAGRQEMAAYNGGTARWAGVSGLFGYRFKPRYQFTARVDAISNRDNGGGLLGSTGANCYNQAGTQVHAGLDCRNGFGPGLELNTGTNQWSVINPDRGSNRQALTLGLSFLLSASVTLKTEYRLDRASAPVFIDLRDNSFKTNNTVLMTSIVTTF